MRAQRPFRIRTMLLALSAAAMAAAGCGTVPVFILAGLAGVQDKPVEEKLALDGTWEIQFSTTGSGQWSDPASPIAQRIDFWGSPMGGDPGNGMRTFATFDAKNVFVETYSYDAANNKIYVDAPNNNPFMGKTLVEQPDGSFTVTSTQSQPGDANNFATEVTFMITLARNESGGWSGQLGFTFIFTANSAMSEDTYNNLPAVNQGDSVTFTWHWDLTLTPSDPPVVLFPDAEWDIAGG